VPDSIWAYLTRMNELERENDAQVLRWVGDTLPDLKTSENPPIGMASVISSGTPASWVCTYLTVLVIH